MKKFRDNGEIKTETDLRYLLCDMEINDIRLNFNDYINGSLDIDYQLECIKESFTLTIEEVVKRLEETWTCYIEEVVNND